MITSDKENVLMYSSTIATYENHVFMSKEINQNDYTIRKEDKKVYIKTPHHPIELEFEMATETLNCYGEEEKPKSLVRTYNAVFSQHGINHNIVIGTIDYDKDNFRDDITKNKIL